LSGIGTTIWTVMYEFKYTFRDLEPMSMEQIMFLARGLKEKYDAERRAMLRAKGRARR